MFTTQRIESNGQISSLVRFTSLAQARGWAASNGHEVVKGYAAKKAVKSGAPVRWMRPDGRIGY